MLSYSGREVERPGASENVQADEQRKPNDQGNSDKIDVVEKQIAVKKAALTIAEHQVAIVKARLAEAQALLRLGRNVRGALASSSDSA